ncbi:MAG: transglycosylase domain-containing protein, partial [Betaproteobacteria bacterium]
MNDDPNAHPGEQGQGLGPLPWRQSRPPGGGDSDGPVVPRRPHSPHRGGPLDDRERQPFGDAERDPFGNDGPARSDQRRGDYSARDEAPRSRRARHGRRDPEPDGVDSAGSGGSDEPITEGPTVGRAHPVPSRRSSSGRGPGNPPGSGGPIGSGGPGSPPVSGGPRPPAIVGRASVRSSGPGSGSGAGRHSAGAFGEAGLDDAFEDFGGDGPDGGGPGGPRDGGPGDGGSRPSRSARARKARRRNIILASFAVFIMLAGIGVVVGAYYVDGIKTPDQLTFPESTTVYYSDGTVLAKLGQVTRYNLTFEQMNDAVKESVVASEDKTFWTNSGVDFGSVLRAAWNNFTGGQTQGGSTITQQYARLAFDLQGATYSRKIREAILAWKLDDQLSKNKILEYYLNAVPFGRNTYGIEA